MKISALSLFGFILQLAIAHAQTVIVSPSSERIGKESMPGYSVELEGKVDEVKKALKNYLKSTGKVGSKSQQVVISSPTLGGVNYPDKKVYTFANQKDELTSLWIGYSGEEWSADDANKASSAIEKLTHQFGVDYMRNRTQAKISEMQKTWDKMEKNQDKAMLGLKKLESKKTKAEQVKQRLETALNKNSTELEALTKGIATAKEQQENATQAFSRVKEVMGTLKEDLSKIH